MAYAQLVYEVEKVEFRTRVTAELTSKESFRFRAPQHSLHNFPALVLVLVLVLVSELFPVTHNSHRVMTRHKIRW